MELGIVVPDSTLALGVDIPGRRTMWHIRMVGLAFMKSVEADAFVLWR
jgi:hypothetical protein